MYLTWKFLILVMCVNVQVHDPVDDMAASVLACKTALYCEKEQDISMSYLLGKVDIFK